MWLLKQRCSLSVLAWRSGMENLIDKIDQDEIL